MHLSEFALEKILTGTVSHHQHSSYFKHLKQCDRCSSYLVHSQDMVMDFTNNYPSFIHLQRKYQPLSPPEPENYISHFQSGFFGTDSQFKEMKKLLKSVYGFFYMLKQTQRAFAHTPY